MVDHEIAARAEAAYLGLAVGDALGATVEFMTPREIRAQHGVHKEICGGGWLRLKPGQVTDDTTMSLALGEAILADGGAVGPLSCARALDAWMRGKPVDIGNTVRRNLIGFRRSGDPVAPVSEHDAGNGAAMRLLPAVLARLNRDEAATLAAVLAQARTTHNSPASDAACVFLALAIRDLILGEPLRSVYRRRIAPFVAANPRFAYRGRRRENPSGWIVESMQAVLQAFLDTGSFEDCLVDVVNRGGDADTTGAIAGMLAGALYGLESIPGRWLYRLEKGPREACRRQARALVRLGSA
jgi:ADP-ribosyl-[dinitrogen reductase] hydrolase